jgi:hypothetical protein
VQLNPLYEWSQIDKERQWRVHTCFDACRPANAEEVDSGFTKDDRPICTDDSPKDIICLDPFENACEVYSIES